MGHAHRIGSDIAQVGRARGISYTLCGSNKTFDPAKQSVIVIPNCHSGMNHGGPISAAHMSAGVNSVAQLGGERNNVSVLRDWQGARNARRRGNKKKLLAKSHDYD